MEIIIINNNSTDATHELAAQYITHHRHKQIRVVNEPKQGLSHARNRGWREARGNFVAYLDDDARVPRDWAERVVRAFAEVKPEPDAVGGKIVPYSTGPIPDWFPVDIEILSRGGQKRFLTGNEGKYGFFGSNMIFNRTVLSKHQGFSPRYGMQGKAVGVAEETDFFRRLAESAPVLWYDPEIVVEHLISENNFRFLFTFRRSYKNGMALAEIEGSRILSWNYAKKVLALLLPFLVRLDKEVKVTTLRGYLYVRLRLLGELIGYVFHTRRWR